MAISLASIKKGGTRKPPITLIHGGPGIGKTSLAASAPAPIFICTEDGLGTLSPDAFPVATTFEEVLGALDLLLANPAHGYQSIVIDSLSALEPLIWRHVAAENGKPDIEALGFGRGYVLAAEYWSVFLQRVIALRDQQGVLPILIAHSEIIRYDTPESESFDRFLIRLHKRAFALMYERADIIGFANWNTIIVKDDVGFNKKQPRGIGTGERLLHLVERPAYIAKNRYNMPETIPLSWQAFSDALSVAFPPATAAPAIAHQSTISSIATAAKAAKGE